MVAARENWGSRFGFIMATAGSAVGLGNIWKFPYEAGANGGGAFLILYLGAVLIFGLSVMMAEIVIGRMTQRNPVGALRELGGGLWPVLGYLGVACAFMILAFYIVVAGWTLAYLVDTLSGQLSNATAKELGGRFNEFITNPWQPVVYALIFMLINVGVVLGGVGAGIERASRFLMPALFVLLLILIIRAVTLPGAEAGLKFFLAPDFSKVTGATLTAALGQAFFSLSLGMGAIMTYGSYLSPQARIPGAATMIVGLDSLVAVMAGLMILPAVFAFGFDPGAGPGLTFVTLPAVFAAMPAGMFFAVLFFGLLSIAALTSSVSLLEAPVCYFSDEFGWSRRKATLVTAGGAFALGIPASLSLGIWSDVHIPFTGLGVFDFLDYLTAKILLPSGGLIISLFVGWRITEPAIAALNNDGTTPGSWVKVWVFILRFIAPAGIFAVLLQGLL